MFGNSELARLLSVYNRTSDTNVTVNNRNENNGINKLLEATLEQNQILMQLLNKNQDLYMKERVVGSILSPMVDENLERERIRD